MSIAQLLQHSADCIVVVCRSRAMVAANLPAAVHRGWHLPAGKGNVVVHHMKSLTMVQWRTKKKSKRHWWAREATAAVWTCKLLLLDCSL